MPLAYFEHSRREKALKSPVDRKQYSFKDAEILATAAEKFPHMIVRKIADAGQRCFIPDGSFVVLEGNVGLEVVGFSDYNPDNIRSSFNQEVEEIKEALEGIDEKLLF